MNDNDIQYWWIPDDTEVWALGTLTSDKELPNGCIQFSLLHSKKIVTKAKNQCFPHYEYDDKDVNVDDLSVLPNVNPASILDATKTRFLNKKIYSSCGNVILSINPFERVTGLYGVHVIRKYADPTTESLPSHLYLIPSRAYTSLCNFGKNQAILISGESGAGKTEAAKECLNFLTQVSSINSTPTNKALKNGLNISSMILEASTILESFGNASTSRNHNSSRFGKWMEINYDKNNAITKSTIYAYLLEKSRVTKQLSNERSYHIFYQLLSGLSFDELAAWKIFPQTFAYRYLPVENMIHPMINDGDKLHETITAFKTCGFPLHEIYAILKIVGSVLLMGNIEFIATENDEACVVSTADPTVEWIAAVLSVPLDMLHHALTSRTIESGIRRSVISIKLNVAKAANGRDSLARGIYERLFHGIIFMLNERNTNDIAIDPISSSVATPSNMNHSSAAFDFSAERRPSNSNARCIGLLDIFGFEILEKNSFEQLCINYCNEILQNHFNYIVFTAETELYRAEGIHCDAIESKDNKLVIGEIEGMFKTLDDEGKLPKGSSRAWYDKSKKNSKASSLVSFIQKRESFVVSHYAAKVEYHSEGMLEKNFEALTNELIQAMMHSSDPIMNRLFGVALPAALVDDPSMTVPPPTPGTQRRASRDRYSFINADPNHQHAANDIDGRIIPTQLFHAGSDAMPSTGIATHTSIKPFSDMGLPSPEIGKPPTTPSSAISSQRKSINNFKNQLSMLQIESPDPVDHNFITPSPSAGMVGRSASMRLSVTAPPVISPANASFSSSSQPRQQALNTKTISWTFKNQLTSLMTILRLSENHFIRCVKSNNNAQPFIYDSKLVNAQLAYSGVYEVVQIQQSGMPCRMPHTDFLQRFKCLAPSKSRHRFASPSDLIDYLKAYFQRKLQKANAANNITDISSSQQQTSQLLPNIQRGRTYVFMKSQEQNLLEKTRRRLFYISASTIQKHMRRFLYKRLYATLIIAVRLFRGAMVSYDVPGGESAFIAINAAIDHFHFLQRRVVFQFLSDLSKNDMVRLRQQVVYIEHINALMVEFTFASLSSLTTMIPKSITLRLTQHVLVVKATDICHRFNAANDICQTLYAETSSADSLQRFSVTDMTSGLDRLGEFQAIIPHADQIRERLAGYLSKVEDEMMMIYAPLRSAFLRSAVYYDDISCELLPHDEDASQLEPCLTHLVNTTSSPTFLCQDTRQLYRDCQVFLSLRDGYVANDDHQGALDYINTLQAGDIDPVLTSELIKQLHEFRSWADMELTILSAQQALYMDVTPYHYHIHFDELSASYHTTIDVLMQYHCKFSLVMKPTRTITQLSMVCHCIAQARAAYAQALNTRNYEGMKLSINKYTMMIQNHRLELEPTYSAVLAELQVFLWQLQVHDYLSLLRGYIDTACIARLGVADADFNVLMIDMEASRVLFAKIRLFVDESIPDRNACEEIHLLLPLAVDLLQLRESIYDVATKTSPSSISTAEKALYRFNISHPSSILEQLQLQSIISLELHSASLLIRRVDYEAMMMSACNESASIVSCYYKIIIDHDQLDVDERMLTASIDRLKHAIHQLQALAHDIMTSHDGKKLVEEEEVLPYAPHLCALITFGRQLLIGRIYLAYDLDDQQQDLSIDDVIADLNPPTISSSSSSYIPSAGIIEVITIRRELVIRVSMRDYQRYLSIAMIIISSDVDSSIRYTEYTAIESDVDEMASCCQHLHDVIMQQLEPSIPASLQWLHSLALLALDMRRYVSNNQWHEASCIMTDIQAYLLTAPASIYSSSDNDCSVYAGLMMDMDTVMREYEALSAAATAMVELATLPCWTILPALHLASHPISSPASSSSSSSMAADLAALQVMDLASLDHTIAKLQPSLNAYQRRIHALLQDIRKLLRQLKYGQVASITSDELKRVIEEYDALLINSKRITMIQQYIRTKQFLHLLLELIEVTPQKFTDTAPARFIPASPSRRRLSLVMTSSPASSTAAVLQYNSYELLRFVDDLKFSLDYCPPNIEWLYETCIAYCDLMREMEAATGSITSSPTRRVQDDNPSISSLIWSNLIESAHFLEEVLEDDSESKIRQLTDGASASSAADLERFFKIIQRKIHDAYKLALSLKNKEEEHLKASSPSPKSSSASMVTAPPVEEWKLRIRKADELNPHGVYRLRKAGYLDEDLIDANIDLRSLCAYDMDVALLRRKGYGVGQLKRAGYSCMQMFKGGFTVLRLKQDGYTAAMLCNGGVGATINHLKLALYSDWDIMTAGYDIPQLRAAGYDVNLLVPYHCSGNQPGAKIKSTTARIRHLFEQGFYISELRQNGYTARQVLKADDSITAREMLDAGYDARELRAAGMDIAMLLDAGLGFHALLAVGYDDKKLLQNPEFIADVERDILMELYRATNGHRWKDMMHWGSSYPVSKWAGVKVEIDLVTHVPRVVELHLWGNRLVGSLPARLVGLRHLQALHVQDNGLTGMIPDCFSQLPALKILDVSNNRRLSASAKLVNSLGPVLRGCASVTSNDVMMTGVAEEKKEDKLLPFTSPSTSASVLEVQGLTPRRHRIETSSDVEDKFSNSLASISSAKAPVAASSLPVISEKNVSASSALYGGNITSPPTSSTSVDSTVNPDISSQPNKHETSAEESSKETSVQASSALKALFGSRSPTPSISSQPFSTSPPPLPQSNSTDASSTSTATDVSSSMQPSAALTALFGSRSPPPPLSSDVTSMQNTIPPPPPSSNTIATASDTIPAASADEVSMSQSSPMQAFAALKALFGSRSPPPPVTTPSPPLPPSSIMSVDASLKTSPMQASSALTALFAARSPPPPSTSSPSIAVVPSSNDDMTSSSMMTPKRAPIQSDAIESISPVSPIHATPNNRPVLSPLDLGDDSAFKTPPDTPSAYPITISSHEISSPGRSSRRNSASDRPPTPGLSVTNRRGSAAEKYLSSISHGAPLDGTPPLPISPMSRRHSMSSTSSSMRTFPSPRAKDDAIATTISIPPSSSTPPLPLAPPAVTTSEPMTSTSMISSSTPPIESKKTKSPTASPASSLTTRLSSDRVINTPLKSSSPSPSSPSTVKKATSKASSINATPAKPPTPSVNHHISSASSSHPASVTVLSSPDASNTLTPAPTPRLDLVEDLEYEALMILYHHTGGKHWKHHQHWGSQQPLSSWHGITTNSQGHVTHIILPQNNIHGVLPHTCFDFLLDLQVLDLRYNQLFSSIPSSLCKLSRLTHLYLHCNALSGPLPAKIGRMKRLLVLDVRSNQLCGVLPASISKLQCLNILALTSNVFAVDYKVEDIKRMLPGCRSIKV